jgi:hypothetical protein
MSVHPVLAPRRFFASIDSADRRVASAAIGVGQNPDPLAKMVRPNGGSRYAAPFRVIPDSGQVPENSVHPETKQAWSVLHERVTWSYLANETREFSPQARSLSVEPGSIAGETDVLTRESSADEVWEFSV